MSERKGLSIDYTLTVENKSYNLYDKLPIFILSYLKNDKYTTVDYIIDILKYFKDKGIDYNSRSLSLNFKDSGLENNFKDLGLDSKSPIPNIMVFLLVYQNILIREILTRNLSHRFPQRNVKI